MCLLILCFYFLKTWDQRGIQGIEATEIVDFRKDWGLSNHIIHGSWDNDSPQSCGLKH